MYLSISYYGPNSKCGICKYAGRLMSAAKANTNTASFYATDPNSINSYKNKDSKNIKSHDFVIDSWNFLSVFNKIRILDKSKTIAHFHYPSTKFSLVYLFTPLVFKILGFKVHQTWHEELSRSGWIKALILRVASSEIFVVKEDYSNRSTHLSRLILKLFKIKYVGTAPLQIIKPKKIKDSNKLVKSIKSDKFLHIFLVFGFIFKKRNIEIILDNIDPSSEILVIAGETNVDLKYYTFLQKLIKKKNLSQCVKFLGFVDNESLTTLINSSAAIIFTNFGGVYNWNTSFLLSCYSAKPVIYFYDHANGKPNVLGFTGTALDFGLPECRSTLLRAKMDDVKKTPNKNTIKLDINNIWQKIFKKHNFHFNNYQNE